MANLADNIRSVYKSEGLKLSVQDYEYFRKLIYQTARINLGPDKKELVMARLSKRFRATGIRNYVDYIAHIESPAGKSELVSLIDQLTTNHTFFFRESAHFDFLVKEALPELEKMGEVGASKPLRIWSSVCSTGEEPYSIAITLAENYERQPGDFRLACSDLSTRALGVAKEGVYDKARLNSVERATALKYFTKEGQDAFRIKPALKSKLTFQQINLFSPSYPFLKQFHIIFCRNVMIYFDKSSQEELIGKLDHALVPGGYLMIGHSESLMGVQHKLQKLKPAVYRKKR